MNDQANSLMSIAFILYSLGGVIILGASIINRMWCAIAISPILAGSVVLAYMLYEPLKKWRE